MFLRARIKVLSLFVGAEIYIFLITANTSVLAEIAAECLQRDDPNLAVRSCSTYIKQNPSDAGGYENRGAAYYLKGEADRALADYAIAIKLSPKSATAYVNRG